VTESNFDASARKKVCARRSHPASDLALLHEVAPEAGWFVTTTISRGSSLVPQTSQFENSGNEFELVGSMDVATLRINDAITVEKKSLPCIGLAVSVFDGVGSRETSSGCKYYESRCHFVRTAIIARILTQYSLHLSNASQPAGNRSQGSIKHNWRLRRVKSEGCWIFSPGPHPLRVVF
jgi:hypothetical protein